MVTCPPGVGIHRDVSERSSVHSQNTRQHRRRPLVGAALVVAVTVVLAGCSAEVQRGFLPGSSEAEVTNQTGRITSLWVGSWTAALIVGVITWGLMLWCAVVYRKRKGDETLPVQLRYHVPLEVMYVILPILMVGVLFYYTARDMTEIQDTSATPDLTVQVVAKQWSWDFNYLDSDVYETGEHAQDIGASGVLADQVTLYLPVDERVEFVLNSRDVIHSFWVPAFLYKKDVIPGRTNTFQIVPQEVGTYVGKCAELCGEEHSSMLFNVKVVTREEYDAHMDELREAGQTGALGLDYSRVQDLQSATQGSED
ncbi:MAG: cytochrome c oxidase subunit II [Cellulomonadaceae bacterium]|nr:cytochrome c oxidase subunit II [Cellulomonadaceae bacterium]